MYQRVCCKAGRLLPVLIVIATMAGVVVGAESGPVAGRPLLPLQPNADPFPMAPHRPTRMPAEFAPQSAILLGANELIRQHPGVFVELVRQLRGRVRVVALVSDDYERLVGLSVLRKAGVDPRSVHWERTTVHTMWARDYGPVFVELPGGRLAVVDGSDSGHGADGNGQASSMPQRLAGRLGVPALPAGVQFQGGNVLTNGDGIVVTTRALLESNLICTEAEVRAKLLAGLGCRRWVCLPTLAREPTGHVDIFVTFLAEDLAVVAQCRPQDDPVNAKILDRAAAALSGLQTSRGPVRVHRVPLPNPRDGTWRSFTNVIFANGLLLVPRYSDVDPLLQEDVLELYRRLLPRWKVVGIPADGLIALGGALRCISANLPFCRAPGAAAAPPAWPWERPVPPQRLPRARRSGRKLPKALRNLQSPQKVMQDD